MKKRITGMKKWSILFPLIAVLILVVSGCKIGDKEIVLTTGVSRHNVMKIGTVSISEKEAKVYLANYQNIYGNSYGVDLWKKGFQKEKLTKYVKDAALVQMSKVACMDQLAEQKKISLDSDEKKKIQEAASIYFKSLTKEEKDYLDVSVSDISDMYQDYALANKVFESLTGSINEEVSDDEARVMHVMQIFVTTKEDADAVAQKLASGEDFAAVASNYNKKSEIEITVVRGQLPSEVESAVFNLDDGAVTDAVQTSDGYYFVKCVSKFDQELTDANKQTIVKNREKAAFNDVYDAFVAGLTKNMNQSLWDSMELITDGTIKTNSFFQTIDEQLQ